uniref:Sugar transporter SWEET1 n=1 Tax=viral metagenome TaxID=1070528 RepID=A0A6C0D7A2_9ZZZZ
MNKNEENFIIIPYTAVSLSIIARFFFIYLMYVKKSTNNISLIFCILNIFSSLLWTYYSYITNNNPLILRSSTELSLLTLTAGYIIRNKIIAYYNENNQIIPAINV